MLLPLRRGFHVTPPAVDPGPEIGGRELGDRRTREVEAKAAQGLLVGVDRARLLPRLQVRRGMPGRQVRAGCRVGSSYRSSWQPPTGLPSRVGCFAHRSSLLRCRARSVGALPGRLRSVRTSCVERRARRGRSTTQPLALCGLFLEDDERVFEVGVLRRDRLRLDDRDLAVELEPGEDEVDVGLERRVLIRSNSLRADSMLPLPGSAGCRP